MFSTIAVTCIAHHHVKGTDPVTNRKTHECKYRLVHKLAVGLDLLIGITVLVVSVLSVIAPQFGIALSPETQWTLIGASGAYTGLMLLGIGLIVMPVKKKSSHPAQTC